MGIEPDIVFTGGVSKNTGMKVALENLLKTSFIDLSLDAIYAGALGAAVYGTMFLKSGDVAAKLEKTATIADLSELNEKIQKKQDTIISEKGTKKVGYLCTYTPLEILTASGVTAVRLFKCGDAKTVSSGEIHTQSVFCDHTKSILGAFREKDPLYTSLDKVYMCYSCDSMRATGEAINEYYKPTTIYNLPRVKQDKRSREFFLSELASLKKNVEELSGKEISDDDLKTQIKLYNSLRSQLKKISELRKRQDPPLTGGDFLDIARGFFYLPPEELSSIYEKIYNDLVVYPGNGTKKIRLMVAGSIFADGDRRMLDIVEKDIGARVVVEDHCTGLRPFYDQLEENGDPLLALSKGYIDQAPCARMKPIDDHLEFSGKLADEYQVSGVIYTYLKFCPSYGMNKNRFLQHFQKKGIPVLEIPKDYSQSDEGQLKTRLEAFIEVLNERRN